ncbi:hypothetical protein OHA79_07965 [Streptomyces sp. NBC_00841]|uniref:hypothetical protein n=1 Tax=unclassified Streptomyces TaxID=2593676 RepID=UPI00224DE808|nr:MULTISPECIES: hypothetical protein [unclassified Streptomyces]MCX4536957.1 hypothetical protein [Streptomyces sp. NBC_01669]WRZ97792.1 hypothetical protein OHA79_07965 [Streptomyces sp. NBC_00841]
MNVTKRPLDKEPNIRSTIVPSDLRTDPEVRAQPVPRAAARIVSNGGRGIARDRLQLCSQYGTRFRRTMSDVGGALPKEWASGDGRRAGDVGALADLAAVRLYLAEEWAWLDPTLLEGEPGAHIPLARCVASGLRRLPAYRGPAIVRTGVADSLVRWYRDNPVVVDHGFWNATSSPAALGAGGPGYLVWSLTGRRTESVDPYTRGRLVFVPGTRFKVLKVLDSRGPRVLMREMFPQEPAEKRPASPGARNAEWLDGTTLEELTQSTARPAGLIVAECTGPRNRPPGLITAK